MSEAPLKRIVAIVLISNVLSVTLYAYWWGNLRSILFNPECNGNLLQNVSTFSSRAPPPPPDDTFSSRAPPPSSDDTFSSREPAAPPPPSVKTERDIAKRRRRTVSATPANNQAWTRCQENRECGECPFGHKNARCCGHCVWITGSCILTGGCETIQDETLVTIPNEVQERVPPNALVSAGSPGLAINIIEGKVYPHHPVLLKVPLNAYVLQDNYLVDVSGLRIPAKFDCDIFNGGAHWGNHPYFYEVPSRWFACWQHHASMKSGLTIEVPTIPLIDDEYIEQVTVYQSVLRVKPGEDFVMAEYGARWGTWGSRAISFLRNVQPSSRYVLYLIEQNPTNCQGIAQVMQKNNIECRLDCTMGTGSTFKTWAKTMEHIDLIDLDIQGGEKHFVPQTIGVLNSKVYRLIIGTHSAEIHADLKSLLLNHGWMLLWEMPYRVNKTCVKKYIRGGYKEGNPDRFKWSKLMADRGLPDKQCYVESPFGPVVNSDGELIFDNPRFVHRNHTFSVADNTLVIDDLI